MRDRYKERRGGEINTIIILIITMLLCLGSIVGTSWALFTNNPEDGTIGINVTSGEVKVDLVDKEQNSLIGDVLKFMVHDPDGKLYFEPGATYCTEGFQVKNAGDIPVNYRMSINNDQGSAQEAFDKAFDVYITNDIANLDTAEKLLSFTGSLAPKNNSDTYYLVIKMKETAGDEFQKKSYKGIGVEVYAVQGNVEL